MHAEEIIRAIQYGEVDPNLRAIQKVVQERIKINAMVEMMTLCKDDVVKFNQQIRPAYLRGMMAKVVKVNKTTVTVEMMDDHGKFPQGSKARVPATLLEKVS
jgi:hypothetical protein